MTIEHAMCGVCPVAAESVPTDNRLHRPPVLQVLLGCLAIAVASHGVVAEEPVGFGPDEPWRRHVIDGVGNGADGVKLADFNGDGRPDIVTGWEQSGVTRMYLAPRGGREIWPAVTVGASPDVEDAVPVDVDGDGLLDVLSLCEGKTASVFVHWAGASGEVSLLAPTYWTRESLVPPLPRMQWMFAAVAESRADGQTVIVAGGKGDGAAIGRIVVDRPVQRGLRSSFPPTRWPREPGSVRWQPLSPAGWIMSIIPTDVDGDGDEDVLYSDRRGPLRGVRWLENPLPDRDELAPWESHVIGGTDREVMFAALADWDGDGRQDVIAAVKPRDVVWLRRPNGDGSKWEQSEIPYPPRSGTAKSVAVGDIDRDGASDLVVTCEGANGDKSGVWWFERTRAADPLQGTWRDISGPEGIKYDLAELIDTDGDGDLDVLTCEESWRGRGLGVVWYENPTRMAMAGERE